MQERDTNGKRIRAFPEEWNDGSTGWLCDFCNLPNAPEMWFYPHKPFEVKMYNLTASYQDQARAACQECRKLIDLDLYALLLERSLNGAEQVAGSVPPEVRRKFGMLLDAAYHRFRSYRTGPPIHRMKRNPD